MRRTGGVELNDERCNGVRGAVKELNARAVHRSCDLEARAVGVAIRQARDVRAIVFAPAWD